MPNAAKQMAISLLRAGTTAQEAARRIGFSRTAVKNLAAKNGIKLDAIAGRFKPTEIIWSPDTWDTGHLSAIGPRGRFRVFRPDCPRNHNGWAFRAHVVWWLKYGVCHPAERELHHIDGDQLNDRLDNLVALTRSQHRRWHRSVKLNVATCRGCQKPFTYKASRDADRITKFCSQRCFHNFPKSEQTKRRTSASMKKHLRTKER